MMKTKKLLYLFLIVIMVLSFAACGGLAQPSEAAPASEPVGESQQAQEPNSPEEPAQTENSFTVTDQAGREVVIEGPVERIVSGYYISSSSCIALGLQDKLVGIEAKANSRPIYKMAAPRLLEIDNVGSAKEFNLEGCIALEPDLVILPKRLKDSANTMTELGIPVILVSPESHDELVEMITLIGKAAGVEENAKKLIDYYNKELTAISALVAPMSELPVVYMAGNGAYLSTAPKGMYQASLIRSAGGINAADGIEGDNWTDVSYEQVLAMNPDVIVIPSEASYSKDDILGDAQLAQLTAVKNGAVYQMPKGFEAWDSPVPSCILGIRWMLSVLHEDVYSMETLQADVAKFYKEFYNVESVSASLIGK